MGHYRKIDTRIHADQKYRQLSDEAKLLFLSVLTHENMTSLGAMKAYPVAMAAELGWNLPKYEQAFGECAKAGMLAGDASSGLLWAVNFLRYNGPENPNVVGGWKKSIDRLPECALRDQVVSAARTILAGYSEAYRNRFDTVAKRSANQEQEHKQEPEQEHGSARPANAQQELVGKALAVFEEAMCLPPEPGVVAKWGKVLGWPGLHELLESLAMSGDLSNGTRYIAKCVQNRAAKVKEDQPEQLAPERPREDGLRHFSGKLWSTYYLRYMPPDEWKTEAEFEAALGPAPTPA